MFTGVTWYGDETPGILPAGAYYHADVINAFQTAQELKNAVDRLPGTGKIVAAHSLGNMVVSSAIADHGLSVDFYYMIDAAVAMQAYKSDEEQIAEIAQPRVWLDYYQEKAELAASDWFRLFPSTDGRYDLRWKGRFGDIPNAVNYYSSGDEVLANNDAQENMYTPRTEKAWIFQEKIKGGLLPGILIGIDSHGGWSFNSYWNMGLLERMPPADAANLDNDDLIMEPFHDPFYYSEIHGPNSSGFASDPDVRAKILAEAIPATSRATGSNSLGINIFQENVNLMGKKVEWPNARGADVDWKHSDSREVAYLYTYRFFDDMVSDKGKGSLK